MLTIQENISLFPYNTFGVEACARYLVFPGSSEEIMELLHGEKPEWNPKFVLGGGSNVLFTHNFEGLIIHPQIRGIEKIDESADSIWIRAGCSENWDNFVQYCVGNNLGGLENLSFIPGTVGACPVQNIGAYGAEVKDCIEKVELVDVSGKKLLVLSAKECKFGYRDSIFKRNLKNQGIITHVTFRLMKNHSLKTHYPDLKKELKNYPDTTIQSVRQAIIAIRRNKLPDPALLGNAGSFFKNPIVSTEQADTIRQTYPTMPGHNCERNKVKLSAAWMIEQCHWKGRKIGKVESCKNQPLVIVNRGGATGNEIVHFALKIQQAVQNRFDVLLEIEVNVL
jgi:UDP-N-acetylmuramate dehydrogenase